MQEDKSRNSNFFTTKSRLCDKYKEVSIRTNPEDRISRDDGRLQESEYFPSQGKSKPNNLSMPNNDKIKRSSIDGSYKIIGKDECHLSSVITREDTAKVSPVPTNSSLPIAIIPGQDYLEQRECSGTTLVGSQLKDIKWKRPGSSTSRHADVDRCLIKGLRGLVPRSKDRGSMVPIRKEPTYKHIRTESCKIGNFDIHKDKETQKYSPPNGQYSRVIVHCQNGRDSKQGYDKTLKGDMGLFNFTRDHNYFRIPAQSSEHRSRLGIQELPGFQRVEISPTGVSRDVSKIGSTGNRPFCIPFVPPTTSIYGLETRSGQQATDVFSQSWHRLFPYAFPPFCLIGRVLTKVRNEKCTLMLVAPVWQTQHWYPLLLEMSIRNPVLLPQHRDLLKDPSGKNHPLTQKRSIHLAVWLVSGHTYLQRAYHRKLQNLSLNLEGLEHYHIMTRPGKSGFAGVMNGSLIPFDVL